MSFAADTKREMCRTSINQKGTVRAEAYGVLLYCNCFSDQMIRIVTESTAFAQWLPVLFQKAFGIAFDKRPQEPLPSRKMTFLITQREKIRSICESFGLDLNGLVAHHVNFAVLEEDMARVAFFRGAFLAGGSVTAPEKRYHLELATAHFHVSREMNTLMQEAGFSPKSTVRKSNYLLYFKQSEQIEDFLTATGAPVAAMELMNAKLEKNLRSSINRRVNCDAANLDKTVDASMMQMEAIRTIQNTVGLDGLPEKLKEAAYLRLENPELTLSQLAELCDPPVTKSCLNHRLRKLLQLSEHERARNNVMED